jgi:hypothetical protein
MAHRKDLVPTADGEFDDWVKSFCDLVTQRTTGTPPEWDHIPTAASGKLTGMYPEWYAAYNVTTRKAHTPLDTAAKNRARDMMEKEARSFINEFIRSSSKVSEEDKESVGIFKADPSPIPRPTAQPEADLMFPGVHLVKLVHIRKAGNLPDDPRSEYGVRIYIAILNAKNKKWRVTAPPETGEDFPYSVFERKKDALFDFDGESGNTVYFCLRYEKQSGGGEDSAGPFGPIFHAVIP